MNKSKRYRNVVDGRIKTLTDEQYKRQFPVWHRGERVPKGGWVEMPEEPKNETAKSISEQTKQEAAKSSSRTKKKANV